METSFQANGSLLGTNVRKTGTYWTVVRPDGTLYGEGQGVMITKAGKIATWTGHGVGMTKKDFIDVFDWDELELSFWFFRNIYFAIVFGEADPPVFAGVAFTTLSSSVYKTKDAPGLPSRGAQL
jgi:hypothetical protein